MSKITNLIGTTWRLDAINLIGVTEEYGVFDITSYGKGIVDGILCDCVSSQIYVGYAGVGSAPVISFDNTITVFYDEIFTIVDGQTVTLNDIYLAYGGEFEGYYEFTITGGTDISNPLFIDFINTYGTLVSGGEPPTAEGVKSKLQSLITASNAKTGKSDANLTDAVKTLLEGYGQGGGGGGINIVDELPEVGVEGEYYGLMTFTDLYIRDGDEGGFMSEAFPPTAKPYFKKAPTLDLAEVKAKIENGGYITCLLYLTEYGDKPNLYTIGANEFTPIEDQMETPFIGEITDTTNATDAGMYAYMSPVVYQYINGAYKLSIPRE